MLRLLSFPRIVARNKDRCGSDDRSSENAALRADAARWSVANDHTRL
ncbi:MULTISPECIES: hypothetical protein [Candidatus Accumulibacter]|jgi:hypothetical protein|nr:MULTISPECIES: hypothetical protein [Candidatus Accumulibacter]